MKSFRETIIIGIDHGYGNMKTANHCFKTGISAYESEPLFTADLELPSLARQHNYREETRKGVAVEYVPNALPA